MDKPEKPPPNPKPSHLKNYTSDAKPKFSSPPPVAPYVPKSFYEDSYLSMDGIDLPPPNLPPRSVLRPATNGIPLHTFIDSNSKNFPLQVTIDTGLYGRMGNSSLYEEPVMLHFEMRLNVVRGKVDHGATYHVPFCSANHFSILHNPTDNIQQAMLGHYYETVGHILAQPSRSRPMAVCVTRSVTGSNSESTISSGDILLLSPRLHTRTFKQGKFMKCIVVETGEVKMLHENCAGGFTTQPDKLKVYLKDIWGHKYCTPPLKVVMYHSLPQIVLSQTVVMTLLTGLWEDSVIATHQLPANDTVKSGYDTKAHTLRILKDIGISIVPGKDEENESSLQQLHLETWQFYNDFDLSKIDQHLFSEDPVWPNFEEIQSMLYKNVLTGMTQDYNIKKPEGALRTVKRRKSVKSYSPVLVRKAPEPGSSTNHGGRPSDYSPFTPRVGSTSDTDVYATVTATDPQNDHEAFFPVHDGTEVIPDVARLLHEVNTANRQMMIHVEGIRAEIEGLKQDLRQTKNIVGAMKRELYDMIGQLDSEVLCIRESMGQYGSVVKANIQSVEAENREILKNFSSDQILQALELLSLSHYKEKFASKRITGLELAEYDNSILSTELGMSSQSDQIRLMLFIQGREAVWKLLENQPPNS